MRAERHAGDEHRVARGVEHDDDRLAGGPAAAVHLIKVDGGRWWEMRGDEGTTIASRVGLVGMRCTSSENRVSRKSE